VHDALRLEVDERVADLPGDCEGLLGRERVLAVHERAQRLALDVLHRHVHPALLARLQDPDDVRVIELLPDLLLAVEPLVEDDVALELRVRDLERDGRAAEGVPCLEDRRHAAPGEERFELVLVQPVADDEIAHLADRSPG
jgi:hypothetical protein